MTRPSTVVLACALLLAACAPSPLKEAAAPKAQPYRSGSLIVGVWGVGPIRETTFFEAERIRALFPGGQVLEGAARISDDETTAVIYVTEQGTTMLEIDDGTQNAPHTDDPLIGSVRAIGGPVLGPHGEHLGLTWTQAGFDLSECEVGVERDANTVFCARPGEGAVTYQFAVTGWDSEEMPSASVMRAAAWLKAIVWTPPPPAGQ